MKTTEGNKKQKMLQPKLIECMRGYSGKQLKKDVVAGILVAVIAFPLSVALAISSGMSPETGLYSAIVGGFFVSLLGGSKVNIGGVTAATVTTVFTIIAQFGLTGLAVATILAGMILIILGLLRAGTLLHYIPRTITLGFTAGIAMGIFSGQLKSFFGFSMGAIPVKVPDKFAAYAKVMDTVHVPTLLIGLLALLVLILIPKIKYVNKIPNSLAAILITTPLVLVLNAQGMEIATIKSVYGTIPSHFPTLKFPAVTWKLVEDVFPSAVTMAILIAIVSLLACVVTDGLMGEKHDSNQELIAQGVANIFCGLFGAAPVAGAVARASNSVKSGGRTPIAGMVHSIAVTGILLFMMPLAAYIPMPTLAAILILVAYNMSNWREFVLIAKTAPRTDFIVLMVTFFAGVFVDLLFAVEIGVLVSALLFLRNVSNTATIRKWTDLSEDYAAAAERPGEVRLIPKDTLIYEIDGPMFFATIDELIGKMDIDEETDVIIIRMRGVQTVDFTAIRALENLLAICQKKDIRLIFSHTLQKPFSVMKKAGYVDKVGEENFCANIDESIAHAIQFIK